MAAVVVNQKAYKNLRKIIILFACLGVGYLFFTTVLTGYGPKKQILSIDDVFQAPSGQLGNTKNSSRIHQRQPHPDLQLSDKISPNCGAKSPCAAGMIPMYVNTGLDDNDEPKLCVNERYVISKSLNGGGRGINVAVIDPDTKKVLRAAAFDTFASDSITLEVFLLSRTHGDIIVLFSHDDGAMKLSDMARKIIGELGSSAISTLKFRGTWYIVTQKGIDGYTPYEKISNPPNDKAWGKALEDYLCIPTNIQGLSEKIDAEVQVNSKKRKFCSENLGYGEFCEVSKLDDSIKSAPVIAGGLHKEDAIFTYPVVVLSGISHHSLPMTLQSLVKQPGINPSMVTVFYLPVFAEAAELAGLFHFQAEMLKGVMSYKDQLYFAMESTLKKYPEKEFVILVEEELILTADFMQYLAQLLPVLQSDPSLLAVSAWNDNGYEGLSSDPAAVYRVEGFPGLGVLMRMSTYSDKMRTNIAACCKSRSWEGWKLPGVEAPHILIPDVSRVYHGQYEGLGPNANALENLFNKPRTTSVAMLAELTSVGLLVADEYDEVITKKIRASVSLRINTEQLRRCIVDGAFQAISDPNDSSSYVIYYNGPQTAFLPQLCQCFGLFHAKDHPSRGVYKGVLRFTLHGRPTFLVSSESPFFKLKPTDLEPLGGSNTVKR